MRRLHRRIDPSLVRLRPSARRLRAQLPRQPRRVLLRAPRVREVGLPLPERDELLPGWRAAHDRLKDLRLGQRGDIERGEDEGEEAAANERAVVGAA